MNPLANYLYQATLSFINIDLNVSDRLRRWLNNKEQIAQHIHHR